MRANTIEYEKTIIYGCWGVVEGIALRVDSTAWILN